MINRLVDFEGGDILIDGQSVRGLEVNELRRGIGYVIQQIGLFPHQTVAPNIGTVPRLLGWDKERIRARAAELLELVGLDPEHDGKRYPNQLSGGQRQRVGLARAMAADPPVMLMDEPFGALDPITRERLQDEFLRLQAQIGKTVVFVTHDIDEAIKMGDRIAILREGGSWPSTTRPTRSWPSPSTTSWPSSSAPTAGSSGCRCAGSATSGSWRRPPPGRATTRWPLGPECPRPGSRRSWSSTPTAARRVLPVDRRLAVDGCPAA